MLESLLVRADQGQPQFVTIVGEPGAGKSRLGAEFALRARAGGATVLVGRCSQEEDAPPLWPWANALGPTMPTATQQDQDDHDAARFAIADSICRTLGELSRDRTVVLGLEDLHWADPSSLRVLRHLAAHTDTARLVVVCTWRRGTQVGPLAEAAEALARRHATTLEVDGLSADETAHLLTAITGDTDPALATSVHQRTEGNPFFLIEYGRLARDEHRALHDVLAAMPPTVAAVIDRRIAQLPEDSRRALTAGAAIGRAFELSLLASALDQPELDVLDLLEPALVVDLVQDLGGDRFRFGHALVRDTAYGGLTPSRRERLHARLAGLIRTRPTGPGGRPRSPATGPPPANATCGTHTWPLPARGSWRWSRTRPTRRASTSHRPSSCTPRTRRARSASATTCWCATPKRAAGARTGSRCTAPSTRPW